MTEHDFTQVRYWLDLAVKTLIGVVVSIVGLDYREMKNRLSDLHDSKYAMAVEIQVVRSELSSIKQRLERIEQKLDGLRR